MTIQEIINGLNSIDDKDLEVFYKAGLLGDDPNNIIVDLRTIDIMFEKRIGDQKFIVLESKQK